MRVRTSSPARCSRASRRQSRRSVSGLVAGRPGDQRRRDHLAAHVHAVQQPGQLKAAGAGLVAGSQHAWITKAADEPADRGLVVGDPLHVGNLLVGSQDPTEIVSLWTSKPRWIGARCETLGTAGSFRMVAPPAQCG
jgi:hypothetical protein